MLRRLGILTAVYLCCGFITMARGAEGEAFTDPAKAGPDFAVQGEYSGKAKLGGAETPVGVQVIARGDGKFEAMLFYGGLPGAGWKRGDKFEGDSHQGERKEKDKDKLILGKTDGGATTLHGHSWTGKISGGKLTLTGSGGETLGTLEKVERTSPTMGAKPPEGAIVLFNGASADEFPGSKMTPDGFLMVPAQSKRKFQDCTLHMEFRTPFMPRATDQGRGNSGIYLQHRYECQVLDSFGLRGDNNECGGFYSVKDPAVNMCLPPLTWQTYDIDFTAARYEGDKKVKNARVTVKHNGVVIHDDYELPHSLPGGEPEGPKPGAFSLQHHGNPVVYRNFWVVEKK